MTTLEEMGFVKIANREWMNAEHHLHIFADYGRKPYWVRYDAPEGTHDFLKAADSERRRGAIKHYETVEAAARAGLEWRGVTAPKAPDLNKPKIGDVWYSPRLVRGDGEKKWEYDELTVIRVGRLYVEWNKHWAGTTKITDLERYYYRDPADHAAKLINDIKWERIRSFVTNRGYQTPTDIDFDAVIKALGMKDAQI